MLPARSRLLLSHRNTILIRCSIPERLGGQQRRVVREDFLLLYRIICSQMLTIVFLLRFLFHLLKMPEGRLEHQTIIPTTHIPASRCLILL
jgi:hypothetical protein